jgi:hypothetical protein
MSASMTGLLTAVEHTESPFTRSAAVIHSHRFAPGTPP